MEFRTAIIDELGDFVCWCDELTNQEEFNLLNLHPEWRRKSIEL